MRQRGDKIINVNDDNNTNIYKATFLYEVWRISVVYMTLFLTKPE